MASISRSAYDAGIAAWARYFESECENLGTDTLPLVSRTGEYIPRHLSSPNPPSVNYVVQPRSIELYFDIESEPEPVMTGLHCSALEYDPLPPGHIRLLKLPKKNDCSFPGEFELVTVAIDDQVEYEALSYVWGNLDHCTALFFIDPKLKKPDSFEEREGVEVGYETAEGHFNTEMGEEKQTSEGFDEFVYHPTGEGQLQDVLNEEDEEREREERPKRVVDEEEGSEDSDSEEKEITDYVRSFRVTESLGLGLQSLCEEDTHRLLWVDQICINQMDIDERNTQVRQMDKVYRNASAVVVWLGGYDLSQQPPVPSYPPADRVVSIEGLTMLAWIEWCAMFSRTWFTRLWVFQEAVLARKLVIARQSCPDMDWSEVCIVVGVAGFISGSEGIIPVELMRAISPAGRNVVRTIEMARSKVTEGKSLNLVDLLRHMAPRQSCSNPKDLVFGLVGCDIKGIFPPDFVDYRKSVPRVYAEATRLMIKHDQSLELLHSILPDQRTRNSEALPSWVPDFTVKFAAGCSIEYTTPTYNAAASRKYIAEERSASEVDDSYQLLILKGRVIDLIEYVLPIRFESVGVNNDPYDDLQVRAVLDLLWRQMYHVYDVDEDDDDTEMVHVNPGDDDLGRAYPIAFIRDFADTLLMSDLPRMDVDPWGAFEDADADDSESESDDDVQNLLENMSFTEIITRKNQKRGLFSKPWHYHALIDALTCGRDPTSNLSEAPATPLLSLPIPEIRHRWRSLASSLGARRLGRRFCVLRCGALALVPEAASEGDGIAIFHGLTTPAAVTGLRIEGHETETEGLHFHGGAFVKGAMNGEAVGWEEEDAVRYVII